MTKEKKRNELEQEEVAMEFSPEELEATEEKNKRKEQQFNNEEK
ncbi:hypothetical protein MHB44_12145 [Lysinibacillus sp. FSL H8-0500]